MRRAGPAAVFGWISFDRCAGDEKIRNAIAIDVSYCRAPEYGALPEAFARHLARRPGKLFRKMVPQYLTGRAGHGQEKGLMPSGPNKIGRLISVDIHKRPHELRLRVEAAATTLLPVVPPIPFKTGVFNGWI